MVRARGSLDGRGMSYMERCAVGLGPAARDRVRAYLVHLGEIAAEAADVPVARFVDRRLSELDTRHAAPGLEPLLSPAWIETLGEVMLTIRDGEPAPNDTARDWANGVLIVLDDMRRHPEAFVTFGLAEKPDVGDRGCDEDQRHPRPPASKLAPRLPIHRRHSAGYGDEPDRDRGKQVGVQHHCELLMKQAH